MSNIDKQALREIAAAAVGAHERLSVMPPDDIFDISLAEGTQLDADITALNALNSAANPATVLAMLDEIAELEQGHCGAALLEREESHAKTVGKLLDELEAAEKRIAELRELLQWAHDTLLEINPNNYTHDDVCEINSASVEVILGIAPVLGETHGKSEEWWAARAAGTAKGE